MLPGQVPALLSPLPQAEVGKGTLTTHVLNTATGLPAAGLGVRLAQLQEPGLQWMELAHRYESWWHLSGAGTLLPGLCELGQRLLAQGSAQPSPGVCLLVAGQVLGWGRAVFWGTVWGTALVWFQAHGCGWALPAPPGSGPGQGWHLQAAL